MNECVSGLETLQPGSRHAKRSVEMYIRNSSLHLDALDDLSRAEVNKMSVNIFDHSVALDLSMVLNRF